jgi:hypothetical protein
MRNVMQAITNLSTQVNGPGTGQGALEGYGYDGTDASAVLELIAYMNTVAWAYYGLVQADRSGGRARWTSTTTKPSSSGWNGQ